MSKRNFLLACAGAAALAYGIPSAAAYAASTVAEHWDVSDHSVRLHLSAPLPIRDARPVLLIDGVEFPAKVSGDRRTLSATLPAGRSQSVGTVSADWKGSAWLRRQPVERVQMGAARLVQPAALPTSVAGSFPVDPLSKGAYAVARADYDEGDQALLIPGTAFRMERRAAVYLPVGASGPRPVVVFEHGMHPMCEKAAGLAWPCPSGNRAVPSYLGYADAAEALASHGYVVVSISVNGINARADELDDLIGSNIEARGWAIMDHLAFLRRASVGEVPALQALNGRLDMTRVGLMGHSRGGAGAARAVQLNTASAHPFGVRALLPLASSSEGISVPGVVTASVLPYCDGDVSSLEGQDYVELSRHAFQDNAMRGSVLMMGGNHNFFNSVWSAVDHPGGGDDTKDVFEGDPVCSPGAASRLSEHQQRRLGAAYIAAFFRLALGDEQLFGPLFDGSGAQLPGFAGTDVRAVTTQAASSRKDIELFDQPPVVRTPGVELTLCASGGCPELDDVRAPNLTNDRRSFTRAVFASASAALKVPVPAEASDASSSQWLVFRMMPGLDMMAPDLTVTVVDHHARRASIRLAGLTLAQTPLPAIRGVPTLLLQDVHVPLRAFSGVDLGHLQSVEFSTPGATTVYLSDLAFASPGVGEGAPLDIPVALIPDVVLPSDPAQSIRLTVALSKPSPVDVTVELNQAQARGDGEFIIPAGKRCVSKEYARNEHASPERRFIAAGYSVGTVPGPGIARYLNEAADGDPSEALFGALCLP